MKWLKRLFKRNTLLDYEWWRMAGYVGGEHSGVNVNYRTALELPAYWRALNILAADVAKLPLEVVKTSPDGSREVDEGHVLSDLLRWKVSDTLTTYQWKMSGMAHAINQGGWYSRLYRDDIRGRVVGMDLIPPSRVDVRIEDDGKPVYLVVDDSGRSLALSADEVLHIRGLTCDGYTGYSASFVGAESLGLGLAAQKFTGSFFGNSARPAVILEHPDKLSPKAKDNLAKT